jgi:hypothetical protein
MSNDIEELFTKQQLDLLTYTDDIIYPTSTTTWKQNLIFVNPIMPGLGDIFLCKKIVDIARKLKDTRLSVHPISFITDDLGYAGHNPTSHLSSGTPKTHWVVTPFGTAHPENLIKYIDDLCETHEYTKESITIIDEMDTKLPYPEYLFIPEFYKHGFKRVTYKRLGFGTDSIGYLPTLEFDTNQRELTNFLAGYNISLNDDTLLHLGYAEHINSAATFISKTLYETMGDIKHTCYVLVLPELIDRNCSFARDLHKQLNALSVVPGMFGKVNLNFDKTVKYCERFPGICGSGQRTLTIIVAPFLPRSIFLSLMRVSHSGLATGDQSFSEFISLTNRVPFYERQNWKHNMAKAIIDHATKYDVEKYIENRIIRPHSLINIDVVERPDTHKLNEFYEVICNHRADVTIEQMFIAAIDPV